MPALVYMYHKYRTLQKSIQEVFMQMYGIIQTLLEIHVYHNCDDSRITYFKLDCGIN